MVMGYFTFLIQQSYGSNPLIVCHLEGLRCLLKLICVLIKGIVHSWGVYGHGLKSSLKGRILF